jgi:poly(A) polymerase
MTSPRSLHRLTAPWLSSPATQRVFAALEAGGYGARAVGGCVRNGLLGLPATDIDIATTALPEDTLRCATLAGLKTIPTGLAHGTVTLIADSVPHEVTTLRRDVATDGRHATVAFTDDWATDASRRDFTINALYCDRHGDVFDPLGGLADLDPLRVRFIGNPDRRIEEDYLRILRFFRFSATFGAQGALDSSGLIACARLAPGLAQISGERIYVELMKLLVAQNGMVVTAALVQSGVLAHCLEVAPQLSTLQRICTLEPSLGLPADAERRLAALCVNEPADVRAVDRRLKLAVRVRSRLSRAVGTAFDLALGPVGARVAIYRLGTEGYLDAVLLAWAKSQRTLDDPHLRTLALLPRSFAMPEFPLAGRDILDLGVVPGPRFARLLSDVEEEWIAGDFAMDRAALLAKLAVRIREQDTGQ